MSYQFLNLSRRDAIAFIGTCCFGQEGAAARASVVNQSSYRDSECLASSALGREIVIWKGSHYQSFGLDVVGKRSTLTKKPSTLSGVLDWIGYDPQASVLSRPVDLPVTRASIFPDSGKLCYSQILYGLRRTRNVIVERDGKVALQRELALDHVVISAIKQDIVLEEGKLTAGVSQWRCAHLDSGEVIAQAEPAKQEEIDFAAAAVPPVVLNYCNRFYHGGASPRGHASLISRRLDNLEIMWRAECPFGKRLRAACVSRDDSFAAIAHNRNLSYEETAEDAEISILECKTGRSVDLLSINGIGGIALSRSGKHLAIGVRRVLDKRRCILTISLYHVASHRKLATVQHALVDTTNTTLLTYFKTLEFSVDDLYLLSSGGGVVNIWRVSA